MAGGYGGREQRELERLRSVFPARVSEALERSRLTKAELAVRAGITTQTLTAYCSGARLPRVPQLTLLAHALGVPVHSLLEPDSTIPEDVGPSNVEAEVLQYIQTENARKHRPSLADIADVFDDLNVRQTVLRLMTFKFLDPAAVNLTTTGHEFIRTLED